MVDMKTRATARATKEMEAIMGSAALDLRRTTILSQRVNCLIGSTPLLTTTTLSSALTATSTIGQRMVKEAARRRSTDLVVGSSMVLKRDAASVDMAEALADVVRKVEVEVALTTTDL